MVKSGELKPERVNELAWSIIKTMREWSIPMNISGFVELIGKCSQNNNLEYY